MQVVERSTTAWMQELETRLDAYMDVGGTIPGMESVESSRDAYTDVGGRKRPEQVFERRPGKRLEQDFEPAFEDAKAECTRQFAVSRPRIPGPFLTQYRQAQLF